MISQLTALFIKLLFIAILKVADVLTTSTPNGFFILLTFTLQVLCQMLQNAKYAPTFIACIVQKNHMQLYFISFTVFRLSSWMTNVNHAFVYVVLLKTGTTGLGLFYPSTICSNLKCIYNSVYRHIS